jgi:AhpD family alkylhydroperoxidase
MGMKRIDLYKVAPEISRALAALSELIKTSSIEKRLADLIYLRVSQLNGCSYCVDLHSHDLSAGGESLQRIALTTVWREVPGIFTKRERAALAWAEEVTELGPHGVSDAVYEDALAEFGEKGLAELNLVVITMNAWNRVGVPFAMKPKDRSK